MDCRALYGMAPLHIAVMREDVGCVQALLDVGADLLRRTSGEGHLPLPGQQSVPSLSTALHLAVMRRSIGIIQTLLQVCYT